MRRVLVTGSRTWTDKRIVEHALAAQVRQERGPLQLIHGGAIGVDLIAHLFAKRHQWPAPEVHLPNYDLYGRVAPLIRNRDMVNSAPDVVLAFIDWCQRDDCDRVEKHGSHGAENCVALAQEAGYEPLIWRP